MMITNYMVADLQCCKLNYLDGNGQPFLLTEPFTFFRSHGRATPSCKKTSCAFMRSVLICTVLQQCRVMYSMLRTAAQQVPNPVCMAMPFFCCFLVLVKYSCAVLAGLVIDISLPLLQVLHVHPRLSDLPFSASCCVVARSAPYKPACRSAVSVEPDSE